MKRCPECDLSFPDSNRFCDRDGSTLVADRSESDDDLLANRLYQPGGGAQVSRDRPRMETWKFLAIMAVACATIGMILLVIYQQGTFETSNQSSKGASGSNSVAQQQIAPPRLLESPSVEESPSPEPSPSPSVMPSPGQQAESARLALSSSPVSTGGSEKTTPGQVIIRLTNGTSIAADEAWETGEGIWYRRQSVITLVERNQVRAVERPSPAAPSPEVTPTASPSRSPQ